MTNDVTGFCENEKHDRCDGTLHSATGHHWWCACTCHPEPVIAFASARRADFKAALAVWRQARSAVVGVGGEQPT